MLQTDDVLSGLATPPVGRSRRVSSNEQPNWSDANNDMTRLAPGQEFEFPVLKGPGYINHIWFTSHAGHVGELNSVSMRIYYDGRKEPGVEVPIGDFFACGNRPAVVERNPVQVSPTGALTCYWRMPFAKSCRIVIRNDNPDRGTGLYWQVDWVQLSKPLPAGTPYFYARYRQEYPAVMGRDYTIADIKGKGKFVGTIMSITMAQDGWFGEGDDFFYIDGEKVPSLQGTGSEDYFNDAWGFRPRTSAWFGQPHWTGWSAGDWGVCYRWHVLDPVNFQKSLKVTIEHKGNRADATEAWFLERPDFISSIALWYQAGIPKNLMGSLPPWPERQVPWNRQHLVKVFRKIEAPGKDKPKVAAWGGFGAMPVVFWPNTEVGATLTLPIQVKEKGRYAIRLDTFKAPDYGVYDILVDNQVLVAAASLTSKHWEDFELSFGVHELSAGPHRLIFRCVGLGDGKSATLAFEKLNMLKLPPEAVREVKGENERHFVRLPIGAAVYCHRLAYGEVPESLEQLVKLGLLEERYLKDENMHPFKSRRKDGAFIIESTAPDHWKHSWRGEDARR